MGLRGLCVPGERSEAICWCCALWPKEIAEQKLVVVVSCSMMDGSSISTFQRPPSPVPQNKAVPVPFFHHSGFYLFFFGGVNLSWYFWKQGKGVGRVVGM